MLGAAVIKIRFTEMGRTTGPDVLVRCKDFATGSSGWHGIIMGGRALDTVENGCLGYRAASGVHFFEKLRVALPRCEPMLPKSLGSISVYVASARSSIFDESEGTGS